MALTYLDIVLVVAVAFPALALGAPPLGYVVGAAAWIIQRIASVEVDRRVESITELRRRLAMGVVASMTRVWLLAITIIVVGITGSREDALTTALVIFGAFSIHFGQSALAHVMRKRDTSS